MTQIDFHNIRNDPNKRIRDNIVWQHRRRSVYEFDVVIENDARLPLQISGEHNSLTGKIKFNVHVAGVGPICRVEIHGQEHGDAGRHHKHELQNSDCPSANIPHAYKIDQHKDKSPKELWEWFVRAAKIDFTGVFFEPGARVA